MSNKVFIFVPAFGQTLTATTFLTTHALRDALAAKGIAGGISTLSFPDIAELRSMVLTIWYDTLKDSSHLCFIDADMGFAPDLVLDMITFGEPLIGTIYPQRKLPLSWAGSGTGETHAERRGNFMRVEGVGMGCTLIHRCVVDKMIEVFPEMIDKRIAMHPAAQMLKDAGCDRLLRFFDKIDLADRGQVSEDLSFCMRWNKCGGQTWAAIGHRISHVGPFDYAGRYLDTVEELERQAKAAAALPPAAAATTVTEEMKIAGAPVEVMQAAE
jgi:hypothetical protein